jgi:diaminohydroxyphosphoribosylaminopyrimidine deaminase/5-amino-6-(5-phosphoribosylamino)uracil reductase
MQYYTNIYNKIHQRSFSAEEKFMYEAILLAEKGISGASPNPMVGAVVVKNGVIAGRGYHEKYGMAHAEINAINDAGIENCRNAVLYVTLEPCSTYGKTPPCTEAIIKAGFSEVVVASADPNPKHAGRGMKILKDAGIKVTAGLLHEITDELNEAFFFRITHNRPFILLKMGITLDGKTAAPNGHSKWITSPEARQRVQYLRRWADAVMVGGNTVRKDRPSLNVRKTDGTVDSSEKQPVRIIVSSEMTEEEAEVYLSAGEAPLIIHPASEQEWITKLSEFADMGINAVLVEGGSKLAGELIQYRLINKFEFHIAPKILGGKNSYPLAELPDPASMNDALELTSVNFYSIGDNLIYSGYPVYKI